MSGSAELQTWHDLACLPCSASHRVEVKDDMAISVYSCHDERSVSQPPRNNIHKHPTGQCKYLKIYLVINEERL